MNRRLARLRSVQALYQMDITDVDADQAIKNSMLEDEQADEFLLSAVHGVWEHLVEIDERLVGQLEHWTLERVGNVDRAILRECVYEMLYVPDIPLNVSVNEAIELAKAFGGIEAGKFVNGVLSNILSDCEREGRESE